MKEVLKSVVMTGILLASLLLVGLIVCLLPIGYEVNAQTPVIGGFLSSAGGTLTGTLGLPDGSAAAPAIFDANNPTQGWYWRAGSVLEYSQNNFAVIQIASNHFNVGNTGGTFGSYLGFVNGSVASVSPNASILNPAAGVTCASADNSTCGGAFQSGSLAAKGTNSVSGCSLTAAAGGAWAGKFASGTTGTCTVTITPGITATNGFSCWSNDLTTTTDTIKQTATSTTTATIAGSTTSGDVLNWGCVAY